METIDDYTIYCTPKQTKAALELGAKIVIFSNKGQISDETAKRWNMFNVGIVTYRLPTTEEMIGWLEEQGVKCFVLQDIYDDDSYNIQINKELIRTGHPQYNYPLSYNSRKEATLAVIDAALEYLSNNKK